MKKCISLLIEDHINLYYIIPIFGNNESLKFKCINAGLITTDDLMLKQDIVKYFDCEDIISLNDLNLLIAANELISE